MNEISAMTVAPCKQGEENKIRILETGQLFLPATHLSSTPIVDAIFLGVWWHWNDLPLKVT